MPELAAEKSIWHLILGGDIALIFGGDMALDFGWRAVHRCDNSFVFRVGFSEC
jgi:hypothetical protein